MKNILKQEKGVSLVSLGVAIIIMMIITGMLIYNTKDTAQVSKLTKMHDDIANLRDKISAYYATYGKVPAYTDVAIELGDDAKSLKGANDIGDFYVIDLKALDGLTLNYGQDYNDIEDDNNDGKIDSDEIEGAKDIYIINEESHNIFYLEGISIDGVNYYTNYVESEKDSMKVNLRYVDGVKIPEGYYYIGKDSNGSIVISQTQDEIVDTNNSNQYKWSETDIEIDENYTLNGEYTEELQNKFNVSFDENEGYFENLTNSKSLLFIEVVDTWSQVYNTEGTYIDEDGYTAYIPAGFCVSTRPSMSKIKNGLVIQDSQRKDEYVWIEVPKYITEDCVTTQQIEEALQNYVSDYRNSDYADIWYDGCYINGNNSLNDYNNLKDAMLESIKLNGGFYIGRYEAGSIKLRKGGDSAKQPSDMDNPVIQKGKFPYNYVTMKQAQGLSESIDGTAYRASLMFGIQWDLVCKFIQTNANLTKSAITTDSSSWGNYNEDKTATGTKQILNIYDIADKDGEFTLENGSDCPIARGGRISESEDEPKEFVAHRNIIEDKTSTEENITFRVTLFK